MMDDEDGVTNRRRLKKNSVHGSGRTNNHKKRVESRVLLEGESRDDLDHL